MEEFIGGINSIWGVIGLAVFSFYKIIDYLIKNSYKRRTEYVLKASFKELSEKLDDHIELNGKTHSDINMQVKRVELLQMIHQSPLKYNRIESLYHEYKSMGGNSYIDDVYYEWKEENEARKGKRKSANK
jgi:hypothetical protein